MLKIKLFLFLTFFFFTGVSQTQWQPDVRLTNSPLNSYTSLNNAWCIATSGSVVHIVWWDNRDGYYKIYYKRSTDDGVNWGTDIQITNNSAGSSTPSVSVSGQIVHVVWEDLRNGNPEIYYKRSTDEGVSWGADTRLTNNPTSSYSPSISVSGAVVHVVWYDGINGNYEIYYKRSTDAGINWGTDVRLTNDLAESDSPTIFASGSSIHVVWSDLRDGNSEIYYKRSTDGGISWGADARLTVNTFASYCPALSVSGLFVHVVWFDERDGNREIYFKRSTDGGLSWGSDSRLTNNFYISDFPSITASGLFVHVVWNDYRDGNSEIYYKRSTDSGSSWEEDIRLTNNPTSSRRPFISISGLVVHVVWYDFRDGNNEIYYKRDPTGNPIGIQPISIEIPNEFSLSQNYPNPFNPSTIIRFNIKYPGFTTLSVFDILGREAATLVNEELKPGTYEVEWNASNYPSGVYYYRIAIHSDKLTAEDYTETKKMVLIK